MPIFGCVCNYCNDASDPVNPYNGSTLLAQTAHGEVIVALHTRCEEGWADKHSCRTLVPLKKMRQPDQSVSSSHRAVH
jgi:hypothetical protein